MFLDDNGFVLYYALIIGIFTGGTGYFTNDWPDTLEGSNAKYVTPKFWNPLKKIEEMSISYTIGTDTNCTSTTQYCNSPLSENTQYNLVVRGITSNGYGDEIFKFATAHKLEDVSNLGLILGLVFGILFFVFLMGLGYIYWKKRNGKFIKEELVGDEVPMKNLPMMANDFLAYYEIHKSNAAKLKSEFNVIQAKCSEEEPSTEIAMLPENKKKNRYVNILACE